MKPIQLLIPGVLVALVLVDRLAFPKRAKRAWTLMALLFALGAGLALYPQPLEFLARQFGVGRPVDFLIYLALAVLIREFFLSRIRHRELARQITLLSREIAISNASGRIDRG